MPDAAGDENRTPQQRPNTPRGATDTMVAELGRVHIHDATGGAAYICQVHRVRRLASRRCRCEDLLFGHNLKFGNPLPGAHDTLILGLTASAGAFAGR